MRRFALALFTIAALVALSFPVWADGPAGGPDPQRVRGQGDMPVGTTLGGLVNPPGSGAGMGCPFTPGIVSGAALFYQGTTNGPYTCVPAVTIVGGGGGASAVTITPAPSTAATYHVVTFTATAGGSAPVLELRGVTGTVARIDKIQIGVPSAAATFAVTRGTPSTGGTYLVIPGGLNDSAQSASAIQLRGYAGNMDESAGTIASVVRQLPWTTGTIGEWTFGDAFQKPLVLRANEAIDVTCDTALTSVTIVVEWTEGGQ